MEQEKYYLCPVCNEVAVDSGFNLGGFQLFKCNICSLIFAPEAFNSMPNYDSVYDTLEYQEIINTLKTMSKSDFRRFAYHPTYRPFFRKIKKKKGLKLLDVGCGVGRFCLAAYYRGWDVIGIDISATAISIAKQYASFPMFVMTLEEMANTSQKFDIVTAFEVLEHLSDPLNFLRLIHRDILKPRGEIFVTVPNFECHVIQSATRKDWVPPVHLCFYTRSSLKFLFEKAGFSDIEIGFIYSDPIPSSLFSLLKWLRRRILRYKNLPLGIWVHGYKHS